MGMRRDLKQARDSRDLVRVVRRKTWDHVEGYVAAVGKQWCVLVTVDDGLYDGHVLLRIEDVRALRPPRSDRLVAKRLLQLDGRWPPAAAHLLDLYDARSVAFTAGSVCRRVVLWAETSRSRAVGDIHRITGRRLHYLTRKGSSRSIALKRLTRIVLWDPSLKGS